MKGKTIHQRFLNRFWKPMVSAYLGSPRRFRYKGLQLRVMPGVFHPGFFFSSKMMADFLSSELVHGRTLLDVGCGSGIIALCASRNGATVTAIDINEKAITDTRDNAASNNLPVEVLYSDLFDQLKGRKFDIIAVNPPYYKKAVRDVQERAWNAGAAYEYFQQFFSQLTGVCDHETQVYLILSDSCDEADIFLKAEDAGYRLLPLFTRRRHTEKLTLYKAERV